MISLRQCWQWWEARRQRNFQRAFERWRRPGYVFRMGLGFGALEGVLVMRHDPDYAMLSLLPLGMLLGYSIGAQLPYRAHWRLIGSLIGGQLLGLPAGALAYAAVAAFF
ncbi:MAG: hypothetical protein ACLQU2_22455 [Candidatus Binataceae bacterium]